MGSRNVCVALLAALGACTASEPGMSGLGPSGEPKDEGPGDVAGNQSGTEGRGACSCKLGQPIEDVGLDATQRSEYPFAYVPQEILGVIEGAHAFSCPVLNVTASVEIVRGAGARILDGVQPSDTGGESRGCVGLELDATLRLQASNGLTLTANKLHYGTQCDIGYRGTLVSVASGDVHAALAGEAVPAEVILWNVDTLIVKYAEDAYDHCTRIVANDGADAAP